MEPAVIRRQEDEGEGEEHRNFGFEPLGLGTAGGFSRREEGQVGSDTLAWRPWPGDRWGSESEGMRAVALPAGLWAALPRGSPGRCHRRWAQQF